MNRQIFQGDVLEQLAKFPDCSVDCIISSPPYWGLRDYSVEGQLGLEPDFHDYLNKMQTIMDELKRVLKNTGTCWINLGDTYSGSGKGAGTENCKESWRPNKKPELNETITAKSRIGIPERFYINCIDSGWIARNHIIWTKNNCMPSSVKDRFTNKWESVFFFSKNKKYYFDLDAVREPTITPTKPFNARVRDSKKQRYLQKATNEEIKNHNGKGERKRQDQTITRTHNGIYDENGKLLNNPKGKNPGDVFYDKSKPYAVVEREGTIYYRDLPPHDEIRKYLASARKDANLTIKELEKKLGVSAHHWFEDHTTPNSTYSYPTIQDWKKAKEILQFDDKYDFVMTTEYTKDAVKIDNPKGKNPGDIFSVEHPNQDWIDRQTQESLENNGNKHHGNSLGNPKGKNPGDIFRINTRPFKEAHFATFPPDLPQKILKCACPNQVCNKCGKPRYPISKPTEAYQKIIDQKSWSSQDTLKLGNALTTTKNKSVSAEYEITGYTDCGCNAGFKPGIVLDPFFGSGTVGLVAEQMGLRWCGIELNPEYIEIAKKRLDPYTSIQKLEAFA